MIKRFFAFLLCITAAIQILKPAIGLYSYANTESPVNRIVSTSLLLCENIRLEMELEVGLSSAYSVNVTAPNDEIYNAKLSDLAKKDNNYLLYADIAVKNLSKDVVVDILDDNENVISSHKTSALEYCEKYKQSYPDGEYIELINALTRLSDIASCYFSDNCGCESHEVISAVFSSVKNMARSSALPDGIIHHSATLVLESQTAIRHYFKLEDGYDISNYTFFVDLDMNGKCSTDMPEKLKASKKGEYYYIELDGISPNRLSTYYKIGVSAGGVTYTCTYGALNYAKNMYEKDTDTLTKNLCATLLAYSSASEPFMGEVQRLCAVKNDGYSGQLYIGGEQIISALRSSSVKKLTIRIDIISLISGSLNLLADGTTTYKIVEFHEEYARIGSSIISPTSSLEFIKKWPASNSAAPTRLEIVLDYENENIRYYINGIRVFDGKPLKTLPAWDTLGNSSGNLFRFSSFTEFDFDGIYVYVGEPLR